VWNTPLTVPNYGGRFIGLSTEDVDGTTGTIDYAIFLWGINNGFSLYENGVGVGGGTWAINDTFRIERTGTTVTYFQNGVAVGTSPTPSTGRLMVDSSLRYTDSAITNIRIFSTDNVADPMVFFTPQVTASPQSAVLRWDTSDSATSRVLFGAGGVIDQASVTSTALTDWHHIAIAPLLPGTEYTAQVESTDGWGNVFLGPVVTFTTDATPWTSQNIAWTNKVGVTVDGANTLSKTASTGWNAGATGANQPFQGDGAVEWVASETNTARMVGLSYTNVDNSYTSLNYALYTNHFGNLYAFESGVNTRTYGAYQTGDVLRVERVGATIFYSVNGVPFYTSTVPSGGSVFADTSLYHTGSTIQGVKIYNANQPAAQRHDVIWDTLANVTPGGGGTLTKTSPNAWNGGAISSQIIPADGGVEFTYDQSVAVLIGLSDPVGGATNGSLNSIAYGMMQNGSSLSVYEKGVVVGTFGSSALGTTISVERKDDVVFYLKDGIPVFWSTLPSMGDLVADVSLYWEGAYLTNARVFASPHEQTPSTIPNPGAGLITEDGATISWDSLDPSSQPELNVGSVRYGTTLGSYPNAAPANPVPASSHAFRLGNLAANTQYYAEISSDDGWGNVATTVVTFVTDAAVPRADVVWTDLVGTTAGAAGALTKTALTDSWDSGAVSVQRLSADGGVEFTHDTAVAVVIGLSNSATAASNATLGSIDYGLMANGSTISVYENGVNKGDFGTGSGATLRVERVEGTVIYSKNGESFYVSEVPSTGELAADISLFWQTKGISNARVFNANTPPCAEPVTADTTVDTPIAITLLGCDPDGYPITYTVGNPQYGSLSGHLDGDASVIYTPAPGDARTDTFTYTVSDGQYVTAPATVTVRVNAAPVAVDDTATTDEDVAVAVNVLTNDTDANGDTLTVLQASNGNNGQTVVNLDQTVTYTPNADWNGTDTFTYIVSDGRGLSATGTVTITVNPVQDAPRGKSTPPVHVLPEDGMIVIDINDHVIDPDGEPLNVSRIVTPPGWGGSATVDALNNANVEYLPGTDYAGPDSFEAEVVDTQGATYIAVISFDVTPVADAPRQSQPITPDICHEDHVAGTTIYVYNYVTDPDVGDTVTFTGNFTNPTSGGTVTPMLDGGGNFTGNFNYVPGPDFNGVDSFTCEMMDSTGNIIWVTITLEVLPANDAPVPGPDAMTTDEDGLAVTINVLANDTDIDGDTLTLTAVNTAGTQGTVTFTANGDVTFTPSVANYNGPTTFTYTVDDGSGVSNATATGTVTVTVNPVNDAPVFGTATATTVAEPGTSTVTVTGSDIDGDVLTYLADCANDGVYELSNGTGEFTCAYTDSGTYTVPVKVSDGVVEAAGSATVTVTNVAPVITAVTAPISPQPLASAVSLSVAFSDVSPDDTLFTVSYNWDVDDPASVPDVFTGVNGTWDAGQGLTLGSHTASHTYTANGGYVVKVDVTDKDGGTVFTEHHFITVYDATQGHITAGGWYNDVDGTAEFGFASVYPLGQTSSTMMGDFHHTALGIDFHMNLDVTWVVLANAESRFTGSGYMETDPLQPLNFMVSMIDADQPNAKSTLDAIRFRIWRDNGDGTTTDVYDSQVGDGDTVDPTELLDGTNGAGGVSISRN